MPCHGISANAPLHRINLFHRHRFPSSTPMPWRVRDHWGSAWSVKRPLEQDADSETQESHNSEHPFMMPTAKPKLAPKLRPRHSIQDLHSSPHASASSAPRPLAAQPRSAEHAPTLETGAPVGVHMLTHQLWPPHPLNQPRAQPAPLLARGGLPVTQPSPLFLWFAEHCHPLPAAFPRHPDRIQHSGTNKLRHPSAPVP